MPNISTFQTVKTRRPGKSVFDLSYTHKLTCDMGQLVPIMCDSCIPGDNWRIGNQIIVRFQPLIAPILHEINVYVHYFFVPYRLLWNVNGNYTSSWEDFITGGVDGDLEPAIPRWTPTLNDIGTLWDHLGFPTDVDPDGAYPLAFPRDAYNLVYNQYYRDETLTPEVTYDQETILNRLWEKDFFASALPWQQRGPENALPVTISSEDAVGGTSPSGASMGVETSTALLQAGSGGADNATLIEALDKMSAASFDVSDLRLAFQIQRWMELNARAGARYVEFIRAHFGPTGYLDARLQRAEYIGGTKAPVIISEVLQTSASPTDSTIWDTAQGNMAGHGITVDSNFAGSFRVPEFGLIIGIMSVMPRADYQQGINRQWLHETKYDFYFPEFAHLSEQAVVRAEIYATEVEADNRTLFGYQGRYDHERTKHNIITGWMRSSAPQSFAYWHLARDFDSAPGLNQEFLECDMTTPSMKRIFAVQDEPGLLVNVANIIRAVRPLPIQSEPGLIDH